MEEEISTVISIKKEIFKLTKDVPNLTNIQLHKKYRVLTGKKPPETTRMWEVEAVVRLIQSKHYENSGIIVPDIVKINNKKFFDKPIPGNKKRRVPKKRNEIDRETLDKERVNLLRFVTDNCLNLIEDGISRYHPENKYATIKNKNVVVLFIEKKLRKIVLRMGGERDRKTSPKINIPIGKNPEEVIVQIKSFIQKNIQDYTNRKDQRWDKCKDILEKTIYLFKERLQDFDKAHNHPSGRYTTLKKGRLVLVFITQDRSKGEISFHPGGERETDPKFTESIDINKISNINDLIDIIDRFLAGKYAEYQEVRKNSKNLYTQDIDRILKICAKSIESDSIFQHPGNLFGIVKLKEKTLLMIKKSKKSKKKGDFDVMAWVKKQKNNPSIVISIKQSDEEIEKAISDLFVEHLS